MPQPSEKVVPAYLTQLYRLTLLVLVLQEKCLEPQDMPATIQLSACTPQYIRVIIAALSSGQIGQGMDVTRSPAKTVHRWLWALCVGHEYFRLILS